MTRTRTGEYKDPLNAPKERRQSRSGMSDIRAIPKKHGAGTGNWGVPGSEEAEASTMASSSPPDLKVSVIDAETFSRLQTNGRNNGQAMSNGEQAVTEEDPQQSNTDKKDQASTSASSSTSAKV